MVEQIIPGDGATRINQFSSDNWSNIVPQLVAVEISAFPPMARLDRSLFKEEFSNPNATIVLLERPEGIAGYTYAVPIHDFDPERHDPDTAYVPSTAVRRDLWGQGYVWRMMEELESELRNKGFIFLERDAVTANGYANRILRHYGERIVNRFVYEYSIPTNSYLKTRRFRIQL